MMAYRVASIDDVPALSRLVDRAFDARYGEGWNGGQLLGTMALPGVRADLAFVDGGLVGFTLARSVAGEIELLLIAVDPDHRSKGIGVALLERAIESARQNGIIRMHLEVRAGNHAACKLYAKRQFISVGTRKAYYQGAVMERFDAITMSLAL